MFTPVTRAFLILGSIAYAIWLFSMGNLGGILFLVAAACLVFGYFRYGTIWLAFQAVRKGKFKLAEKLIGKVFDPNSLNPQSRAYYHWVHGMLALKHGDLNRARDFLDLAATGKLRTSNDRSMVACTLTQIALAKGDRVAAEEQLQKARH